MNTAARIAEILRRARIDGGWLDEIVAEKILMELGLDMNGRPVSREPTSSNLEHG